MRLLKSEWLPPAPMERVICHWTAGAYDVSELDREHYHFIVDGYTGKVVKGYYDVDDNLSSADGVYAGHTYGLNTGSIGVAVACMAGAQEKPFSGGGYPMNLMQWEKMAEVVAELCEFYKLPVTERTVLQHGEVHEVYGIDQWGKWDCMVLPWDVKANAAKEFRKKVIAYLMPGAVLKKAPVLEKTKLYWHPKSAKANLDEMHLSLQVKGGKLTAIKINGVAIDPKEFISGTVELVRKV